jgi:histidinol-phosphatase (PHP family)
MTLNGVEVAAKISGKAAERLAVLLYAVLKDQKKTRGKTRLTSMLRSGKELKVFSVNDNELEKFCREEFGGDYYRLAKAYYELEAEIYERTRCTFVGHFDLVTRFNDQMRVIDENDRRYTLPALEAMEYLVSKGLPFEINCGAVNRGRKAELYPNRFLLRSLRGMGGEILINSDAHQKELLNGGFDIAARTAVECGFTHTLFLEHGADGKVRFRHIPLDDTSPEI